jgi:geranylgeranyl pyrophosphate synthase
MGKPIGSDLYQGTLTLPAMLLLEQYPDDNPVKELFRNPDMPEGDKRAKVRRAIEMVQRSSIVKQCYQVASDYCQKACRDLGKLPDKPSRQALNDLTDLVISRKK